MKPPERTLVISDLHGDMAAAWEAIEQFAPDLLLCCGDWGDPEEVSEAELAAFPERLPVYTTFGNHDPLEWLARLRNRDGSPVLLPQGETQLIGGLRVAAVGGIWAKSHRQAYYVTDEEVAAAAARIATHPQAGTRPLDLLLTHGCPIGLADLTPTGRHGGQRCFLELFQKTAPHIYLCGHLHVAQERRLADGRAILNVGATPHGSAALLETRALEARLVSFPRGKSSSTKEHEIR